MERRQVVGLLGAAVALGALGEQLARAAEDASAAMLEKCSRMCAQCSLVCHLCARHCQKLHQAGKKEYDELRHRCASCGDLCALVAREAAWERPGLVMGILCEAGFKLCDACATACARYPDDKQLAGCAKECRACSKMCLELVNKVKGGK